MKIRFLIPIAMLGATAAHASPVSLGLHGGVTLPTGDLSRAVGDGFHIGASVSSALDARYGSGVELNYHVLGEHTLATRALGLPMTTRQSLRLIEAAVFVRANLTPRGTRAAPYLEAGFGVDHVRPDITISGPGFSIRSTDSDVWPGVFGGAGVWVRQGRANAVSLEVLFRQIVHNKPGSMVTVSLGLRRSAGF